MVYCPDDCRKQPGKLFALKIPPEVSVRADPNTFGESCLSTIRELKGPQLKSRLHFVISKYIIFNILYVEN